MKIYESKIMFAGDYPYMEEYTGPAANIRGIGRTPDEAAQDAVQNFLGYSPDPEYFSRVRRKDGNDESWCIRFRSAETEGTELSRWATFIELVEVDVIEELKKLPGKLIHDYQSSNLFIDYYLMVLRSGGKVKLAYFDPANYDYWAVDDNILDETGLVRAIRMANHLIDTGQPVTNNGRKLENP